MATIKELKATARPKSGKGAARAERRAGRVPAVIYGDNQAPLPISVDDRELRLRIFAGHFLTTIFNIRKESNPGLVFLGMLPSRVDARNPRHKTHLDELRQAYPQLLAPIAIGLRSSIADALATRVPVWKIRKTAARAAAKELRALGEYVLGKMFAGEKQ